MAAASITPEGPAIGIDLGTTFSCVAVVRNGKVEVIANELGNRTTPSYVAFNEIERLIGDAAKQQLPFNPTNTIFDAKRLIGRKFADPVVQKDTKQWPFAVVDVNDLPKVRVTYKDEEKLFAAEEISAAILERLKEIAESYLNSTVKNAVVTVPAHFNDMQRQATMDAAKIAGLNVLRIISEPVAAAIAYGLNNDTEASKNVLIYDLGGGTFDVSVLNICGDDFVVKATDGDSHLGGEDFNEILMQTFANEFYRKNNVDINANKKALCRLRAACELAKRTLSTATQTVVEIDLLCDGIDFRTTLTRARFEKLCEVLFGLTIKTVKAALKEASLRCEDIDTVVLVGGSTRIPKIQQLLRDLFKGKEISKTINPDEAVVYGAAVQAAKIHGGGSVQMENMKLIDVTPLTLGISGQIEGIGAYKMAVIIERNTPLPVMKSRSFNVLKYETSVNIRVLQGEHTLTVDNFEVGNFRLSGIPADPLGREIINVTFSIDANGILSVTAVSNSNTAAKETIQITNVCGSLSKEEIDRMVLEAEQYRRQNAVQYHSARYELEKLCEKIKIEHGRKGSFIYKKCDEILSWLSTCCRPALSQFNGLKNELQAIITTAQAEDVEAIPIVESLYEIDG